MINYLKTNSVHFDEHTVFCERTSEMQAVDISPVNNREIPHNIINDVTQERVDMWADLINSVAHLSDDFGSVKGWAMFTDIVDIPHYSASTALLVDCHSDSNGRVASLVVDDHGRIGVDVIFDSFEEYERSLNEWNSTKITDPEELKQADKLIEKSFEEKYSCDNPVIAKACTHFSCYIRLVKGLDFYYG